MFTNQYFPAYFIDSYFIPVGVDFVVLLGLYVPNPKYPFSLPSVGGEAVSRPSFAL